MTRDELELILSQLHCDSCERRIWAIRPRWPWIRRSEYYKTMTTILIVTAHAAAGHPQP